MAKVSAANLANKLPNSNKSAQIRNESATEEPREQVMLLILTFAAHLNAANGFRGKEKERGRAQGSTRAGGRWCVCVSGCRWWSRVASARWALRCLPF